MSAVAFPGKRPGGIHHESFLRYRHFRWLIVAIILCVGAIAAFWFKYAPGGFRLQHSGGTWLGYTLGTTGALLMLWLTAFGVRKRAITQGNWSLRAWLSAHVYLGLSLVVIVTLHTGFQFGWNLHTAAYALMLVVIASGAVGAVFYYIMPERLGEVRHGATKKQMLEILRSLNHSPTNRRVSFGSALSARRSKDRFWSGWQIATPAAETPLHLRGFHGWCRQHHRPTPSASIGLAFF
jgi:hypothetical protein